VTGRVEYDEWGKPSVITPGLEPNYTGYEYDQTLGIYYAKARFYDPNMKRFMKVDHISENVLAPVTMTQYTYCLNNPLSFTDPLGLDAIWIHDYDNIGTLFQGHTSLLIESAIPDPKGGYKWAFFFFAINGVKMYEVDKSALESLDNFNKSYSFLSGNYESSTYIQGDFTQSLEAAHNLALLYPKKSTEFTEELLELIPNNPIIHELFNTATNKYYSIFNNNCSHVSLELLKLGILKDGTKVEDYLNDLNFTTSFIPNYNNAGIISIFGNRAFTKENSIEEIENNINILKFLPSTPEEEIGDSGLYVDNPIKVYENLAEMLKKLVEH
jgi:RHS repeat-associated protein